MDIFDIIEIIVLFSYVSAFNYFYHSIYKNTHKPIFIYVIQFICCIFYPFIKRNNDLISSFFYFLVYILPLFYYKDRMKNKIIYYIFIFAFSVCLEVISAAIIIVLANLLGNSNYVFINTMIKEDALLYLINMILLCVGAHLGVRFIGYLKKDMNSSQFQKIIFIIFLPITLMGISTNILFSSNINTFMIISVISWSIAIVVLIFVNRVIDNYLAEYHKSKENREYQQVVKLQITHMQSIDCYYKNLRKNNHDFQNHCVVISNMINEKNKKTIDYIDSFLKYYRE